MLGINGNSSMQLPLEILANPHSYVRGPQQDINSVMVMDKILDTESPQLVVLNGE